MNTLSDISGRVHTYLRLSVTERCNLACMYCAPGRQFCAAKVPAAETTLDEIAVLCEILADMGVNKVRLTGGEPLVRKDLEQIAGRVRAIDGIEQLGLTTNAINLAGRAKSLKESGVGLVNVSIDTLRAERFREITGADRLHDALAGLDAALDAGFERVKLNVVVIRRMNDDELCDFVELACRKNLALRFIEFMPFRGNRWSEEGFLPAAGMKKSIAEKFELTAVPGTDKKVSEYAVAGFPETRIGFIASISDSFCSWCNRLRLTADGRLMNCLFSAGEAVDLLKPLREGLSREYIAGLIHQALLYKPAHHASAETLMKAGLSPMIGIGG